MEAELSKFYKDNVVKELKQKFNYTNVLQVPKLKHITVNMGLGNADKKTLESAVSDIEKITGQKALVTRARKSIAGFKIREDMPLGCMVTLRGKNMWEFLKKLIYVTIPRVRDFRGLNAYSFDGRGNYNFGIKEQIVFPEIDYDKIDAIRGLNITIATSAKSDDEARALLKALMFPFKEEKSK